MQRRPLLFLMFALALVFVASYTSRLAEYRRLQTEKSSLHVQIVDAEARGRELIDDLDHVKSNEYVEEVAITELGMANDNVTVLTIIDEPISAAGLDSPAEVVVGGEETEERGSTQVDRNAPGWRQWLSIFSSEGE